MLPYVERLQTTIDFVNKPVMSSSIYIGLYRSIVRFSIDPRNHILIKFHMHTCNGSININVFCTVLKYLLKNNYVNYDYDKYDYDK